jgi:transposase-like protein
MSSSARAVPFHCPFCGEEDLRPHGEKHGQWECRSCQRAFSVSFLGILNPQHDPTSGRRTAP